MSSQHARLVAGFILSYNHPQRRTLECDRPHRGEHG
nr:MAG TPA: hypothetical protein [Caudoviricetes sp.]